MNLDLQGKTALVCGGSEGIGLAAARELASFHARVVLLSRSAAKLKEAVHGLPFPERHHFCIADLSDIGSLGSAIQSLCAKERVDILVNNSGGPAPGPALQADVDLYRKAFEQHVVASQLLVQAIAPGMKERGFGRIINVVSVGAKTPLPNLGVSNTIRGAVANWAKTLAHELAPFGITVNNVLPGYIRTGRLLNLMESRASKEGISVKQVEDQMKSQIPSGRIGLSEEIGAAIAFLASPAASYITGINLPVDGGRTDCL
ncbi:MAG: SDR family oxidoreductase [Cytophagales bacterium]|nr:SDR family oxidoreductase [Cytophagales bacterium]